MRAYYTVRRANLIYQAYSEGRVLFSWFGCWFGCWFGGGGRVSG
ncbi:hypothetical protein [Sulfolobus acidocaldarius]|uniref:Uncharacterized protein n=3 Tax=Sulfolobus acidocaldarius TaxID=2285 RepID=Q4JBA1_SULAC|nr:hypothetical protein [Sulfolobus acidocaldarius]AAY79928.1 hypothetical protein Saci_0528 [Sulfolobus acidocaldarius DSM 639]AGE70496.1 hypothetical protein SacN8_02590 [Sulfolobus acidocaldarius N8]AGE72769.1 hypothetical protein SacRon12I_02580 [Sulfolobus acidocaldarius Ron12/I]